MNTIRREIFVAGNGPSLKEVDFEALRGREWLGMNAAYRYWEQVGIFPTVYCCLDKVVIKSHATEIGRLLDYESICKAFLVKDILEPCPELESHPKVDFLEDLVEGGSDQHRIFKTYYSGKKTTGSWAVRYLIFQGYNRIYLSGIDCNYVEVVSGARVTGRGIEVEIESEREQNPNYFFAGYQQKGDVYQIPNPVGHFGSLHLQSLEAVKADIDRLGLDVEVVNTAKNSLLHRFGVFGYMDVREVLQIPHLTAVAVALTSREVARFTENLELWDLPAFHPLRSNSPLRGKVTLHVFLDGSEDADATKEIVDAYKKTQFVKEYFKDIRITYLNIPPSVNFYKRDKRIVDISRKIGPNIQFLLMMKECAGYDCTFLMEADCTPGRADWLGDLDRLRQTRPEAWIVGSYVTSLNNIDPAFALQINGVALYATGNDQFQSFMDDVFEPALRYFMFEKRDPHIAYDCLISKIVTYGMATNERAEWGKLQDQAILDYFKKIQPCLEKLATCDEIENLNKETETDAERSVLEYIDRPAGPCVIHSQAVNEKCRNLLRRRYVFEEEDTNDQDAKKYFWDSHIKPPSYRLFIHQYFSSREGLGFEHINFAENCVCLRGDNVSVSEPDEMPGGATVVLGLEGYGPGDRVAIGGKLLCQDDVVLGLQFSRHGNGEFVQDRKELKLRSRVVREFQMEITLRDDYDALRLVLFPLAGFSRLRCWFWVLSESKTDDAELARVESASTAAEQLIGRFVRADRSWWGEEWHDAGAERYDEVRNGPPSLSGQVVEVEDHLNDAKDFVGRLIARLDHKDSMEGLSEMVQNKLDERPHFLNSLFAAALRSPRFSYLLPQIGELAAAIDDRVEIPHLVYIDPIHRNTASATQELRKKLLRRYPGSRVTLVHPTGTSRQYRHFDVVSNGGVAEVAELSTVLNRIRHLTNPKVVVRTGFLPFIAASVYNAVVKLDCPIITVVMDTWDMRMESGSSLYKADVIKAFHSLLRRSRAIVTISEEMSQHIYTRYGMEADLVVHNFISTTDGNSMRKRAISSPSNRRRGKLTILYAGGLEKDMTLDGILKFVDVLRERGLGKRIRLKVKTFSRHVEQATTVQSACEESDVECQTLAHDMDLWEYTRMLDEADAYLLTYGFDPGAKAYVQCSMPNKLVDLLTKQKPIVYFGPKYCVSRVIEELGIGGISSVQTSGQLANALQDLCDRYEQNLMDIQRKSAVVLDRFGEPSVLGPFYRMIFDGCARKQGLYAKAVYE